MNYRILIFSTLAIGILLICGVLLFVGDRLLSQILTSIQTVEATLQTVHEKPDTSVVEVDHPHADLISSIEQRAGMKLMRITRLILRDEGVRSEPYLDSEGYVTIGIGRSLSTNGISTTELHAILPDANLRQVLSLATVSNGRITMRTLSTAKKIFNKPLTAQDIELLLTDDLRNVKEEAVSVFGADWQTIDSVRQDALIDLIYNLGLPHFKSFEHFIEAVKKQEWKKAASELLNSDAARKHIRRYHRTAAVIESGDPSYFELKVMRGNMLQFFDDYVRIEYKKGGEYIDIRTTENDACGTDCWFLQS